MKELKNFYQKNEAEAGCDEAGRGCLAGPVFAAAVILPSGFFHPFLNDSKAMTEKHRLMLRDVICEKAIAWSVAQVENPEIDRINILNASIKAMHLALDQLQTKPGFIIVDGNRFHQYKQLGHQCIIGGDGLYASIAAASVLAKTFRDEYMVRLDKEFPQYLWSKNKGYPTLEHRAAIIKHGITPYHRKSFNLSWQLSLDI